MAPTKNTNSALRNAKSTRLIFSRMQFNPNGNLETIQSTGISILESIETMSEWMKYSKPQFIWASAKHKNGQSKYLEYELLTWAQKRLTHAGPEFKFGLNFDTIIANKVYRNYWCSRTMWKNTTKTQLKKKWINWSFLTLEALTKKWNLQKKTTVKKTKGSTKAIRSTKADQRIEQLQSS